MVEGAQYRGSHNQYKRATPFNAEEDAQCGSVTSSVGLNVYSTGLPKPLRVVGGLIQLGE